MQMPCPATRSLRPLPLPAPSSEAPEILPRASPDEISELLIENSDERTFKASIEKSCLNDKAIQKNDIVVG